MRYRTNAPFDADYKKLSRQERQLFRDAIQVINATFAQRGDARLPIWPASLRIKSVESSPGIWEMTWSFSGPDGRATFSYFDAGDGEAGIAWRRIGDHRIFRDP